MIPPHIEAIKKDDFYVPTLQVLRELGGSASIEEIEERLIDRFSFTQADLDTTYPTSGDTIVTDKMSWARSYLKFPGFVTNDSRGVWVLTEAGRLAVDQPLDALRKQIRNAKAARRAEQLAAKASRATADVADDEADETIADWSDLLLAKLQSIEPAAFERLCQRLLREHGFTRVEVTGKSGDGGIDGQGVLRVNLVSFHVLFQCKRYKGSVGAPTIRDFRGAMQGRADKGLVITTGTFTPDARREATRDRAPAIDLIDGEALCNLLREVGLGVVVRPVTTYEISVDGAFFDEI
ncbi:restriction endonuclease [Sphingomonas sp. 10B4]|uniref:restriction endonuclease n=1 Tax=Sphingomonas sp. 10B4 TaxID=3048575 RepID=UPI002AB4F420|nr:restriction endonuclease [Sphingomonas sp. 10B4]MDY7523749.1 restriction endonuclease [Sphingomonas sp. 10B4]MEB0283631.1 restriction endonuclease [Sphingomonas sp. 10B4]